jgi:hypothetical protein
MRRSPSPFGLVLAALMALPALPASAGLSLRDGSGVSPGGSEWIGRGGGGGGGGGRGGGGRASGNRGGSPARAHSGFQGSGSSFSRGDRRPQGGFSEGNRANRVGNPSLERPSRPAGGGGLGERNLGERNLGNRELGNRELGNRNVASRSLSVDRDWNRNVNIGNIDLHPGWARPGWGVARPWNWGWYGGWSNPPWGWWGARAAAWGIGTLATAAIINDAVNDAVQANQTLILVPNTGYQLLFGSVQPSGSSGITFVVRVNGSDYQLSADCQQGLLNGREPSSAAEAELLNAACQVAFGTAG